MPVENGWTLLVRATNDLNGDIAAALERGARDRERYEFFSAIGHELRTPLTSIRGYLETLLDEETDGQNRSRFLETARREALRMGRLLDGMFEFSLFDLSVDTLAMQQCDLRLRGCSAGHFEVVRPPARAAASVTVSVRSHTPTFASPSMPMLVCS